MTAPSTGPGRAPDTRPRCEHGVPFPLDNCTSCLRAALSAAEAELKLLRDAVNGCADDAEGVPDVATALALAQQHAARYRETLRLVPWPCNCKKPDPDEPCYHTAAYAALANMDPLDTSALDAVRAEAVADALDAIGGGSVPEGSALHTALAARDEIVRAGEREACAKVAEDHACTHECHEQGLQSLYCGNTIADRIRARGVTK